VEEIRLQLPGQGPAPRAVERRTGPRREPEAISVAPGQGVVARMEIVDGRQHRFHPDVRRKKGVQSTIQLAGIPAGGQSHGSHLAYGVDAPVGSSRSQDGTAGAGEALQDRLHLTLHRPHPGLDLPSQELRPVVVEGQPEPSIAVGTHALKLEVREVQSRTAGTPVGAAEALERET
jgi:hypothetical protein